MQSIFRLPWCTDALGGDSKPDVATMHKMRQSPMVDIPLFNKLKRKRSMSPDLLPVEREIKRKKPCDTESLLPHPKLPKTPTGNSFRQAPAHATTKHSQQSFQHVESPDKMSLGCARTKDDGLPLADAPLVKSDLTLLQQMIENEFNNEILIKHRELTTIEQELAKCQVALEQLRRCEVIPYPGSSLSEDVSNGTGSALRAQTGYSQPSAPAPWGVVDGPYSKHYSSWLLPDPTFDSLPPQPAVVQSVGTGRPSRQSGTTWHAPTKSRHVRESSKTFPGATATQQISRKGGPLVLKRLSDNQFVKLVCTKCHRSDFSSVQGFLNHCRIAHKIDYKSHEAAAQDCGRPLEEHESDLAATAPPPVGTTVRTPAPKAQPPPQPVVSRVHPLAQDMLPRPTWKRQRLAYMQSLQDKPTTSTPTTASAPKKSFVPSTTTPHLSAMLAKRGAGMDLASVVALLAQKVDLGPDDADETEDSQLSGTGTPAARPTSKRAFDQGGHRPRPAPLHNLTPAAEIPESPQDVHDLSPNTADSNPGMVSDHEEDDADNSDPEEGSVIVQGGDAIHSIHRVRSCGAGHDEMDIDVEVEDEHGAVVIRPRGLVDVEEEGSSRRGKFGRGAQ